MFYKIESRNRLIYPLSVFISNIGNGLSTIVIGKMAYDATNSTVSVNRIEHLSIHRFA